MKVAVIISTYDSPEWLEKVLEGYRYQNDPQFEVIICDDGSDERTSMLVDSFRNKTGMSIIHEWHCAKDYQRQKILNQCIRNSRADYLVLTDGDCIPRQDFVSTHVQLAEKGSFLSGGYCKLPMSLSKKISLKDIETQKCFDWGYLWHGGFRKISSYLKLTKQIHLATCIDSFTTTKATWNNCNSSAFRSDLLKVNGFDERMKYGGADRELGERLWNLGLKSKQIRHRAVCLHLDHERGYANKDSIRFNQMIRQYSVNHKVTWTPYGIERRKIA